MVILSPHNWLVPVHHPPSPTLMVSTYHHLVPPHQWSLLATSMVSHSPHHHSVPPHQLLVHPDIFNSQSFPTLIVKPSHINGQSFHTSLFSPTTSIVSPYPYYHSVLPHEQSVLPHIIGWSPHIIGQPPTQWSVLSQIIFLSPTSTVNPSPHKWSVLPHIIGRTLHIIQSWFSKLEIFVKFLYLIKWSFFFQLPVGQSFPIIFQSHIING